MIAVCTSTDEVGAAVTYAREQGLPVCYGGGHRSPGASVVDGGLMIDMRGMKGIAVDPDARTLAPRRASTGASRSRDEEHGLAVTGGRVPDTGIVGLALGQRERLARAQLGFTCDNLIAAEVVTADGARRAASDTENPDLFWALQVAGGNFGIVPSHATAAPDRADRSADAGVAARMRAR